MSGELETGGTAPDFTEAVVGFRAWRLYLIRGLCAVATGTPWTPGVNEARCVASTGGPRKQLHTPPAEHCTCGIYALHRIPPLGSPTYARFIIGSVALWGEMEVYDRGVRAQYACVTAFALRGNERPEHRSRLRLLASEFGVALVPYRDLRKEALRFASPLPASVLPPRSTPPGPRPAPTYRATYIPRTPAALPRQIGWWLEGHIVADCRERQVTLTLSSAYVALLDGEMRATLQAPRTRVECGDAIAVIDSAGERLVVKSPLAGMVEAVNAGLATDASGWIARISPDPVAADETPLVWGEEGRRAYLAHVASLGPDDAIRFDLRLAHHLRALGAGSYPELAAANLERNRDRPREQPLANADAVQAAVDLLDRALAQDARLCSHLQVLELSARFSLCGRESSVDLIVPAGARPRLLTTKPASDPRIHVSIGADALHRYWLGELDLRKAQLADELDLIAGSIESLVLLTAVLQRLSRVYRDEIQHRRKHARQALAAAIQANQSSRIAGMSPLPLNAGPRESGAERRAA